MDGCRQQANGTEVARTLKGGWPEVGGKLDESWKRVFYDAGFLGPVFLGQQRLGGGCCVGRT